MTTEKRPDGWWITDVPDALDCGPYDTLAEAESDLRGIARLITYGDRPGFVTSDSERKHDARE
ncbi:MAG TPA: hypothetical protein VMX97_06930 [Hyphomicrobiaceae bacterium]|nr:hypothetical protein [Hyphomicrobiaceae bacterium]